MSATKPTWPIESSSIGLPKSSRIVPFETGASANAIGLGVVISTAEIAAMDVRAIKEMCFGIGGESYLFNVGA